MKILLLTTIGLVWQYGLGVQIRGKVQEALEQLEEKTCVDYAQDFMELNPLPDDAMEKEMFMYLLHVVKGAAGLAAQDGVQCPKPYLGKEPANQTIKAQEYSITANGGGSRVMTFPESRMNLKSSAVCLSGGGNRAFASNVGQLRALEKLELMSKFGYLSSVSGGSWAAIIYTFYAKWAKNDEDLFGPMTKPSELSMSKLNQAPPKMLQPATDDVIVAGIALLLEGKLPKQNDMWTESVGVTYLERFGLNENNFVTLDGATENRIKKQNRGLKGFGFYKPRLGRPFLVTNAALVAPDNYQGLETVSFQVSPLGAGSPFVPNGSKMKYESLVEPGMTKELMIGGGQVETFAYGSSKAEQSKYVIQAPFSLRQMAATSSNALGYLQQHKLETSKMNPTFNYFPVGASSVDTENTVFVFGDGDNIDFAGVLSMLQRGNERLVVFWNTDVPLPKRATFDACMLKGSTMPSLQQFGSLLGQYFGVKFPAKTGYFNNNQVFPSSMYAKLVCEMQKLNEAGKPATVLQELDVLENTWWGISSSKKKAVKIVWYYLNRAEEFIQQLPQDTQDEIAKGADGEFPNFPNYATFALNHGSFLKQTNAQVNLLSSYTQWTIEHSNSLLQSLLQ